MLPLKSTLFAAASVFLATVGTESSAMAAPISVNFLGTITSSWNDYQGAVPTTSPLPPGEHISFHFSFDTDTLKTVYTDDPSAGFNYVSTHTNVGIASNSLRDVAAQAWSALSSSQRLANGTWNADVEIKSAQQVNTFEKDGIITSFWTAFFLHADNFFGYTPDILLTLINMESADTIFDFHAEIGDSYGYSVEFPDIDKRTKYFGSATITSIYQGTTLIAGEATVPEPLTLALLGVGLAALGVARQRKAA